MEGHSVKIIKVTGCNVCPYVRNRSSRERGDDRKCSAVDPDEEGYDVELTAILNVEPPPKWCPLEDDTAFVFPSDILNGLSFAEVVTRYPDAVKKFFVDNGISKENIPPEFAKLINDNFWDLV